METRFHPYNYTLSSVKVDEVAQLEEDGQVLTGNVVIKRVRKKNSGYTDITHDISFYQVRKELRR